MSELSNVLTGFRIPTCSQLQSMIQLGQCDPDVNCESSRALYLILLLMYRSFQFECSLLLSKIIVSLIYTQFENIEKPS